MNLLPGRNAASNKVRPLPMTSMIDVVFLLLIFFMVTANFSADQGRLAAALASRQPGSSEQNLQPQVVRVRWAGTAAVYELGSHRVAGRRELTALLRQLPKDPGVVIEAADDVPVAAAAAALQAAADAGFSKRSYVPGALRKP